MSMYVMKGEDILVFRNQFPTTIPNAEVEVHLRADIALVSALAADSV
jgi:hypothetical protein